MVGSGDIGNISISYDILKTIKFKVVSKPTFDDRIEQYISEALDLRIKDFYERLKKEAVVPSHLFVYTNTTQYNFEEQVYIERRLLEIGEDYNDPIAYIRIIHKFENPEDKIVGQIYFVLSSMLIVK